MALFFSKCFKSLFSLQGLILQWADIFLHVYVLHAGDALASIKDPG